MTASSAARGSHRDEWDDRARLLDNVQKRMNRVVGLGLHHSPAAAQNWYAQPEEMLSDALRTAWLVFGLHVRLGLEEFAPEHLDDLDSALVRQRDDFITE
jgi:hypothetical protein